MVQERFRKPVSGTRRFLRFLALNTLPIGGVIAFVWGLETGRISLDDLPKGLDRNAVGLGLGIAVLFVVVTLFLPAVHAATSWAEGGLKRSAEIRSRSGFLRLLFELLLWPIRQLVFRLGWCLRFLGYLAALALIAASLVFIVRFLQPDFLEDRFGVTSWMERGEAWLSSR